MALEIQESHLPKNEEIRCRLEKWLIHVFPLCGWPVVEDEEEICLIIDPSEYPYAARNPPDIGVLTVLSFKRYETLTNNTSCTFDTHTKKTHVVDPARYVNFERTLIAMDVM